MTTNQDTALPASPRESVSTQPTVPEVQKQTILGPMITGIFKPAGRVHDIFNHSSCLESQNKGTMPPRS
jgi:hypothetical protein